MWRMIIGESVMCRQVATYTLLLSVRVLVVHLPPGKSKISFMISRLYLELASHGKAFIFKADESAAADLSVVLRLQLAGHSFIVQLG